MTVFGLTINFAGANGAVPSVAQSFVMQNGNGITEGAFAGAKFDIVGYMGHPCYDFIGTEAQSCAYDYNLSEPLKTYVENGALLTWLGDTGLLPGTMTSSVSSMPAVEASSASSVSTETNADSTVTMTREPEVTVLNSTIDSEEDLDNLLTARSNKLWNICLRNDATREAASLCYQQNIRLLMRLDLEITEDNVQ